MSNKDDRSYYTTGQAAEIIEVDASTIFRWCEAGKLQGAYRVNGRWRIPKEDFHAYLKQCGIE